MFFLFSSLYDLLIPNILSTNTTMDGSPYYPPSFNRQQQIPPGVPPHYMMSSSSPHLLMSPQPLNHHSFPPPSSNQSSQHRIYPPFYPHAQSQPPQATSAPQEFQFNNAPLPQYPVRQVRRYKTVKRLVQIPQGKLVLNCPVPIQYLERVPLRDPKEFNMMRYTAITCDPNEFHQKNYTLRQEIMNRETEIAICITMYNVSPTIAWHSMRIDTLIYRKMKYYCQERCMAL